MLKRLLSILTGRQNGFKPTKNDRLLIDNVYSRLCLFGTLDQPEGTTIRSIPGAIVEFMMVDGAVVAMVTTRDNRRVGYIEPSGRIHYLRPTN